MNAQFDIKRINALKNIFIRLRNCENIELIQADFKQYFNDVSVVDLLLIELELINGDYGISIDDVRTLSSIYPDLYNEILNKMKISNTFHQSHPVQIFKKENTAFQVVFHKINQLLESLEKERHKDILDDLTRHILKLGEFHNHYHRKEKLFFPIMERYGYHDSTRMVWRVDDRIRALYQAVKRQIIQQPDMNFTHLRKTFDMFEKEFRNMIFQEDAIILPVLLSIFSEDDWLAIAKESDAFGYAMIESEEEVFIGKSDDSMKSDTELTKNIRFGGGYLTTEEANLILNNLPLEITFVDKNSIFKYFNETTEPSEMMLVRTPISIGRNVANCHPPKSLKKVMTLIRDLKTKKRTSESMWYKTEDKYIHLTYKALFNEQDEFLGILEYVQDIQPFFELSSEVKNGLSKLDE